MLFQNVISSAQDGTEQAIDDEQINNDQSAVESFEIEHNSHDATINDGGSDSVDEGPTNTAADDDGVEHVDVNENIDDHQLADRANENENEIVAGEEIPSINNESDDVERDDEIEPVEIDQPYVSSRSDDESVDDNNADDKADQQADQHPNHVEQVHSFVSYRYIVLSVVTSSE